MKLVDLNARFTIDGDGRRVGVRFACPMCLGTPHKNAAGYDLCSGISGVPFSNPLDGAPLDPRGWQRTGETIATLTLYPSIWVNKGEGPTRCEWHGWVKNGEISILK